MSLTRSLIRSLPRSEGVVVVVVASSMLIRELSRWMSVRSLSRAGRPLSHRRSRRRGGRAGSRAGSRGPRARRRRAGAGRRSRGPPDGGGTTRHRMVRRSPLPTASNCQMRLRKKTRSGSTSTSAIAEPFGAAAAAASKLDHHNRNQPFLCVLAERTHEMSGVLAPARRRSSGALRSFGCYAGRRARRGGRGAAGASQKQRERAGRGEHLSQWSSPRGLL